MDSEEPSSQRLLAQSWYWGSAEASDGNTETVTQPSPDKKASASPTMVSLRTTRRALTVHPPSYSRHDTTSTATSPVSWYRANRAEVLVVPVSGNRHHQRCPSQVGLEQLPRTPAGSALPPGGADRSAEGRRLRRGPRDVGWSAGVHRTFTSNIVAVMVATTVAGSKNFEILSIACMYFHPVRSTP